MRLVGDRGEPAVQLIAYLVRSVGTALALGFGHQSSGGRNADHSGEPESFPHVHSATVPPRHVGSEDAEI